jgi:hypothetical protein
MKIETSYQKVVRLFRKQTSKLIKIITLKDTIWSTPEHPFFTTNGWINAKNLVLSSLLVSSFGNQQILALSEIDSVATVYNFEVEHTHTYVVGNAQLYVHNTCVVTNQLLSSGKLDPDDVAAFTADFGGNNFMLNKFASGEISVDAWKTLDGLPSSVKTYDNIKAIDDFASINNVDYSLIKTEISTLGIYKNDLLRGFKVSNGEESINLLKRDLSLFVDIEGSYIGDFINGQFVSKANSPTNGIFDFVVLTDGSVKIGNKHTFLSNGANTVKAAGEIEISNGIINKITNASGHYTPSVGDAMNYLRIFQELNINVSNTTLEIFKFSKITGFTSFKTIAPNSLSRKLYQ